MTRTTFETLIDSVRGRVRAALVATIGAVVLAGCSLGGPTVDPANDPAPPAVEDDSVDADQGEAGDQDAVVDDDEFDLAAYCARATPMTVPVEREFVGTDEHVQMFRDLRAVAPEELDAAIALLIDHYDLDVSPSDPDSQDYENFPADVQEAAQLLGDDIAARC